MYKCCCEACNNFLFGCLLPPSITGQSWPNQEGWQVCIWCAFPFDMFPNCLASAFKVGLWVCPCKEWVTSVSGGFLLAQKLSLSRHVCACIYMPDSLVLYLHFGSCSHAYWLLSGKKQQGDPVASAIVLCCTCSRQECWYNWCKHIHVIIFTVTAAGFQRFQLLAYCAARSARGMWGVEHEHGPILGLSQVPCVKIEMLCAWLYSTCALKRSVSYYCNTFLRPCERYICCVQPCKSKQEVWLATRTPS